MDLPPTLTAVATGAALAAAVAQHPGADRRAIEVVDRAIAGFKSAGARDETIRAARAVLDAAQGARSAFNAPDRARDAAYARYHAALRKVDPLAVRCDNGYPCSTDERGNTGVVYFDGLVAAFARVWEARSGLSATNAAYLEAVGIAGAAEARAVPPVRRPHAPPAGQQQPYAGETTRAHPRLQRREQRSQRPARPCDRRARAADRAALDALGRVASALSSAAERLTDDPLSARRRRRC